MPFDDADRHLVGLEPRSLLDVELDVRGDLARVPARLGRPREVEARAPHRLGQGKAGRIGEPLGQDGVETPGQRAGAEEPVEAPLLVGEGRDLERPAEPHGSRRERAQALEAGQDAEGAVERPAAGHRVDVGARHDDRRWRRWRRRRAEPAEDVPRRIHARRPARPRRSRPRSHARAASCAGLHAGREIPPEGSRPMAARASMSWRRRPRSMRSPSGIIPALLRTAGPDGPGMGGARRAVRQEARRDQGQHGRPDAEPEDEADALHERGDEVRREVARALLEPGQPHAEPRGEGGAHERDAERRADVAEEEEARGRHAPARRHDHGLDRHDQGDRDEPHPDPDRPADDEEASPVDVRPEGERGVAQRS